jgi:hypothetical protein
MNSFRSLLCPFLAWLMLVMPNLALRAQEVVEDTATLTKPAEVPLPDSINTPNENAWPQNREDTTLLADPAIVPVPDMIDRPLDITYLLPQACVVVSIRPQQIMHSPLLKLMPIEVVQAASLQQTGIDALLMERLLISMEPPAAGPPNYAVMVSFTTPVANKLLPQVVAQMEKLEEERPHYKSAQPFEPSVYFPQDDVLLATPEATLQKFLLGGSKPGDSELHKRLKAAAKDDVYVGVDFAALRPLVNMAMMQTQIPPELGHFYLAPDLIKLVELRLNLSQPGVSELTVEANNAEDAEKLEQVVQKTVDLVKAEAVKEAARLKADPDPVQQALGRYQERVMNEMADAYLPTREGEKLVLFRLTGEGGQTDALTMTAVSGILVALLLPAVQAAREAARRTTSTNNLRQIMLGMHNYHDAKKSFPPHANYSGDDKPLLSWRVHLLPFIEQEELYSQFRLDEPWDSEHNQTLIAKMPELFIDPSSGRSPAEGRTHYLGVKGEGMLLNGTDKGTEIRRISDGTARTIAVLQVNDERATTWTKPDDWELDSQNVLKGLSGSMHPGTFLVGFADGSVRPVNESIDPTAFKGMLTIAGGEDIPAP